MEKQLNAQQPIIKLKSLISETVKETMEEVIENMEALAGTNYINAIKEAREEYTAGKTTKLEDLFNV